MNEQLDHDSRYKEIRELFFTYARGLAEQMKAEQRERGTLILMGKGGAEPTANECLVIGVGVCPTQKHVEAMLRAEQAFKETSRNVAAFLEGYDLHPDKPEPPDKEGV